jgi:exodeoxyribonuclease VII large subunit
MDNNLFNLLKEKRKEIAQREGKKLFMLFHNSVLEKMAETKPRTKAALEKMKGWSKKKIEKYGDEILAVINGTQQEEQSTPVAGNDEILSVQELIAFLNNHFTKLGSLNVRGEITQVKKYPNYCFFTIKDPQTQEHLVDCFIGRAKLELYDYLLETGMEVVVSAAPSIYKSGRFSLTVQKIEAFGEGALKRAFEALKAKLQAKGYFDEARKRPIPDFIQKIGLITSESGAAINDFRKNLGQYGFKINLVDVRVEGDSAEQSIISAINWLNKNKPDLDVLVLIRGGGSLENFKAFNSEGMAEAIVTSRLPVITGIGHEKDESIADLAADLSLSTPTATAAFIRNQREKLLDKVTDESQGLIIAMENIIAEEGRVLLEKQSNLIRTYGEAMQRYKYWLIQTATQMQNGLDKIFNKFRGLERSFIHCVYQQQTLIQSRLHQTETIARECFSLLARKFQLQQERLRVAEASLTQLNPEAVLKKGYSIIYKADNKVLKEAKDVVPGEKLNIKLFKGQVVSSVEAVKN